MKVDIRGIERFGKMYDTTVLLAMEFESDVGKSSARGQDVHFIRKLETEGMSWRY
jgi:hypothetical protein